jgi:ribosomal protein S4E
MSNSRHLKRHTMPTSWTIKRKGIDFISRPNSGSYQRKYTISMLILLREFLNFAKTSKEAKYILKNKNVLINGKKVEDIKAPLGLFEVVEFKELKKTYTIIYNTNKKVEIIEVKNNDITLKVKSKTKMRKNNFQLNTKNGFNILITEKEFSSIKVNDSVVYDLKTKKILKVLNLKEEQLVYIYDGKFIGNFGIIKSFTNYFGVTKNLVTIDINGTSHNTSKDYIFAVSEIIKMNGGKK